MIYAGADPGKQGGITILWEDGNISTSTIPIINDDIDVRSLTKWFNIFDGHEVKLILEDVHAIFGSSAKAMFTFGKVNGVLQTLIEVHSIPFVKVSPKAWQKVAFQGIAFNEDKKVMAAQAASRLFPKFDFPKAGPRTQKYHDGIIDAALMAYYGKVMNL